MFGLSLAAFTLLHVGISLIGILAGFVWLISLLGGRWRPGWNALFLVTTILTSTTGFQFPRTGLTPAQVFGALSLVVLAVALVALLVYARAGWWRTIYAFTSLFALYLNTFVLIVQAFLKLPPLHALAPTNSEPPFAIAQGALLIAFVVLGFALWRHERAPVAQPGGVRLGR